MTFKTLIKACIPSPILKARNRRIELGECIFDVRELLLQYQTQALQRSHPNPLNAYGNKCFSQSDEDGITLEILRRIGCLEHGTFCEFGVGDGMENNTLILKALGWRGFWVGGEDLAFTAEDSAAFCYLKDWVTLDNIERLTEGGMRQVGATDLDVVSLDLDGNDIYFVERLLGKHRPKLFIAEYNAKFPPPVKWKIEYDPHHVWRGDDYFGASLASFGELFERHDYRLVCCNSHTGSNAFFVRSEFLDKFTDVPKDMLDIYVPPRYFLCDRYGFKKSLKAITVLF